MCMRIECPSCGKPGFTGCGMHVEQVLGDVPPAQRCTCQSAGAKPSASAPKKAGWWPFG